MSNKHTKPKSYSHVSSGSLDTIASVNAESTFSIGLSMFPEPPTSTPSTPLRSEFGPRRLPIRPIFPAHLNSPPHLSMQDTGSSEPSSSHAASRDRSVKSNRTAFYPPHAKDSVPGSSAYDSDGTSSIDVDERLLPTSFITALLQENKARRRLKNDAMSGISELTYPPLLDKSDTDNSLYSSHSSGRHLLPSNASPQTHKPFSRISSDSHTLHSNEGHTPMIGTASVSGHVLMQGAPVVGVAPSILRNVSSTKQCSSSVYARNPLSTDKYSHLSTYNGGDDPSNNSKTLDSSFTTVTSGALLHGEPVEPHNKDRVVSPTPMSLLSRIPGLSLRRWKKDRPLPPVPDVSHILPTNDHRKPEEPASLNELINPAGVLRDILTKGQYPHRSLAMYDLYSEPPPAPCSIKGTEEVKSETVSTVAASGLSPSHPILSAKHQPTVSFPSTTRKKKRKRRYFLIYFVLIVALVAIGIGVGVFESRKKPSLYVCMGNFTGAACNLDATCVCTSSFTCLAKAVVDLVPIVNQNFASNISLTSAFNSLWIIQGSPMTNNCASQALLVDIGNADDEHLYPNRTQWAETALLWNAIQTQDMDAAGQLQQFVQKIPWTSLGATDGPVSTADSDQRFSTTVAGFTFNFASQTVTQPSASFVTLGQPKNAQISRVSSQAQNTLDRMYAFAQASSIQHQTALTTYWTSVLLQPPQDLSVFKAALSVSPILLPFNASSRSIRTLYSNSTSLFPPPLACFPNLTREFQQQINSLETGVFGLQPIANTTSEFDTSCYQDRPVYGVVDVLRLRLPFFDSQIDTVKEAVALTHDASPRVIIYNGLLFSTAPSVISTITPSQLDARQYGTLSLFDHVVLQYLTSIPDVNTTNALVSFVLGAVNASTPPDESSPLFQSLQSIPFLEVAVFGDVGPPDLTSTVASFTMSPGSLFFGTADGADLRDWTITTVGGPVVWTENATSPLVVRDSSLDNTSISQIWNAISIAISDNISGTGLANITTMLQKTQEFSP